MVKKIIVALPNLENFLQQAQGVPSSARAGVWPKVATLLITVATIKCDLWELVLRGYEDIWITFVISKQDVIAWVMPFNKIIFQQQGFCLRVCDSRLNVCSLRDHFS